MMRLGSNMAAINSLFGGMFTYLTTNSLLGDMDGDTDVDMDDMMAVFFNDFAYAYQTKMPNGAALPIPYALRAYDYGNFYSDNDDFQASTRDYVRNPLIESAQYMSLTGGTIYNGNVGLAAEAMEFGMGLLMCNDMTYPPEPSGFPDVASIVADWQADVSVATLLNIQDDCNAIGGGTMRQMFNGTEKVTLPSFYDAMPSAELMGLDLNNNGKPLTYVQLLQDGIMVDHDNDTATADVNQCDGELINDGWCSKVYYA